MSAPENGWKGVGYAEHKWRKLLNSKCRGQPEEEVYCKHVCYRIGKLEEGHEPAKQTEQLRLTGPKNYAEQRVRKIKKLFREGCVRERRGRAGQRPRPFRGKK